MKKLLALLVSVMLFLPALAGAQTTLPFGLSFGLNVEQTETALRENVNDVFDMEDYGNGTVDYLLANVTLADTTLIADSMSVQVDTNNSARTPRLSFFSLDYRPQGTCIADFRTLLAALTTQYGKPLTDPFDESGVNDYKEWGTLSATWETEDVRISLSMTRMYEESITLQFTSRLNYDEADLK